MKKISPHLVGLMCGAFFAIGHAVWSLMVALGFAQTFLDWILSLHFVDNPFTIQPFSLTTAVTLVVFVFIVWYIIGWISGWLWNWFITKK
jgi:hypothetical protein